MNIDGLANRRKRTEGDGGEVLAGVAGAYSELERVSDLNDRVGRSGHSLEAAVLAAVPLLLASLLIARHDDPYPLYLTVGSWSPCSGWLLASISSWLWPRRERDLSASGRAFGC